MTQGKDDRTERQSEKNAVMNDIIVINNICVCKYFSPLNTQWVQVCCQKSGAKQKKSM